MDPWLQKGRTYWEQDEQFQKFNGYIMDPQNKFTFEQVYDFCMIDHLIKLSDDNIKTRWLQLVHNWNKAKCLIEVNRTYIYAAITYLFIVLPHDQIKFSPFELKMINRAYFYEYGSYINTSEDLSEIAQPELDNLYSNASWWLSYRVYERQNGLDSLM